MKKQVNLLIICGAVAGPMFVLAVFIEGATRPGYNSFLYPLSSLAMGEQGWTQISNFIFTGTLYVLFSFGLKRVFNNTQIKFRGPILIRLVGIGLIGAGIFVTDPIFGYPNDQPMVLRQFTVHGHLHDAFSMLVFICLPWACFAFSKRFMALDERGWAMYSTLSGSLIIIAFILSSMGFKQVPSFVNYAGVFQRTCIAIGWIWLSLLSIYVLRKQENN